MRMKNVYEFLEYILPQKSANTKVKTQSDKLKASCQCHVIDPLLTKLDHGNIHVG